MENVIIQTAFLGDLVLSIPLMRQMVSLFPEEPLTVICRQGLGDVVRSAKVANKVIEVNKRDKKSWTEQQKQILALTVNHIVCPHESPRTAVLVRKMKAAGHKVGFEHWWNGLVFDRRVKKPMHLPDALRQLSLLTAISNTFAEEFSEVGGRSDVFNSEIIGTDVDYRHGYIPVWAGLSEDAGIETARPDKSSKIIYMAPGSAWATKRWTTSGYIEVAKRLVGEGWQVHITGSPDEKMLGDLIKNEVPEVQNFAGQWSASETVAHYRQGRALVANDSGAIHLAALASLPTVAIFGPTTLNLGFRPWQRQAIVVQKDLKCRPCGKHGHQECPIKTHECMVGLAPQQVLSALEKLM